MAQRKFTLSNRTLKVRVKRKSNPLVAEIIQKAHEHPGWQKIGKILSSSTRHYSSVNLSRIDKETKVGDTVIILGKVLASGDLSKKVRIVSLSSSMAVKEKLKKTKSEFATIEEEIKINPKAEGIKVIQ